MKTLFVAYRVADLDRSLDFYTSLGYVEVGSGPIGDGVRIALLRFPDEPVATLELVHRPGGGRVEVGGGFDHLAIQVDALAATLEGLREAGLEPEPVRYPGGPDGPRTSWLTTLTATGSSLWSGRPGIPTASPKRISLEEITASPVTKLSRSHKRVSSGRGSARSGRAGPPADGVPGP